MTLPPTQSALQAVAALAALTYEPLRTQAQLIDRLVTLFTTETPYRQGALLLRHDGQQPANPAALLGSWGLDPAALDELRARLAAYPRPQAPIYSLDASWQAVELASLGRPVGTLLLYSADEPALPDELLLALASQVALLCGAALPPAAAAAAVATPGEPLLSALQVASSLYQLAGQTDLRRFMDELARGACQLPQVSAAALYLQQDGRLALASAVAPGSAELAARFAPAIEPTPPALSEQPNQSVLLLQQGQEQLGALLLLHPPQAELQALRRVFELFAAQCALALRTAQLYESERGQGRDLFVLYENSRMLSASSELSTTLDRLCENVAVALESDHCMVLLWDAPSGELELGSAFDTRNTLPLATLASGARLKPAPGSLPGMVLQSGRPLAIADLSADQRSAEDQRWLLDLGLRSVLCAPLIQQERTLGLLLAGAEAPQRYSSSEITLLQTLASQAAIALGHARLLAEERQRSTEMELLHNLSRELSSGLSLQQAADAVVRVLDRLQPGTAHELTIYDREAQLLRAITRSPVAAQLGSPSGTYQLDEGLSGWLARHRRPLRVADLTRQRGLSPANPGAASQPIRAFLGVPLLVGDELVGTLELGASEPDRFSADDERLLMIIASQAAQAVHHAIRYETADEVLRRRLQELTALQRISHKLTSTFDLQDILDAVLQEARQASGAAAGLVALYEEPQGPRLIAAAGYSDQAANALLAGLTRQEGALGRLILAGEPQIVDDLASEAPELALDSRSLLLVPVVYQERIAALIVLGQPDSHSFTHENLAFVRALADQVSLAIGNAQHFTEQVRQRELLQRRASLLNEVLEIGNALRADRELPDLLEQIAFSVVETAGFRAVVFNLIDRENPQQMYTVAGAGVPLAMLEQMRRKPTPLAMLAPFLDQRFRLGRAYFVPEEASPDETRAPHFYTLIPDQRSPGQWQPGDLLLVPLYSTERELIGLLSLDDPFDQQRPTRRTVETLEIFANQAAIAVENAWLFRDRDRQIRELEAIRRVGQVTSSTLEIERMLLGLHEVLTDFLPVERLALELLEPSGQLITRSLVIDQGQLASSDQQQPAVPGPLSNWLLHQRQPLLLGNFAAEIGSYPELAAALSDTSAQPPSYLGLPLLARDGQPIGTLALQHQRPAAFGKRDVDVMLSVAHQVSLGLQNARLLGETQRQATALSNKVGELSALLEASRALSSLHDPALVLDTLVRVVGRQLAVDTVVLLTLEPDGYLVPAASLGLSDGFLRLMRVPAGQGLSGSVADSGQPLFVANVQSSGGALLMDQAREQGLTSYLGVPVRYQNRTLGVLSIMTISERSFDADEIALLSGLADQAAIAMENARLFSQREHQIALLQSLNDIGGAITSTLDTDQLLQQLLRELSRVVDTSDSLIALYDEEYQRIIFPVAYRGGEPATLPSLPLSEGVLSRVIRERHPILLHTRDEVAQASRVLLSEQPPASWIGVPIVLADRVLGAINIQSSEAYAFGDEELRFLGSVASQAAIAMENARLFRERERRIRELDALNRISQAVTSTLDLQPLLERLHHGLGEIVDVRTSFIGLYDSKANTLSYPLCFDSGKPVHFDPMPVGERNINAWVISNRQPLLIGSAEESAQYRGGVLPLDVRKGQADQIEQSYLIVPILAGDEVLGVINIQSYDRHAFSQPDLNFVSTVAAQAAAAIHNAHLFSARERSIQELSTLNKIGQALGATVRLEDLLQVIYEQTSLVLDTTNFYMALYDERHREVSYPFFYEHGKPVNLPPQRNGNGLTEYVIRQRKPLLIGERFEEFLQQHGIALVDEPAASWLGVPMIAADKVIGVIGIQDYERQQAYGEHEVRLLSTIANQAAQALENARLFGESRESVRELSTLSETSVSLAGTLEMDDILTIGASSAMELGRADFGGVLLLEEGEEGLLLGEGMLLDALHMPIPADELRKHMLRVLSRLSPLREGQVMRIPDAQADRQLRPLARQFKMRGMAILPVMKEQRLGGAVLVGASEPRDFEERALASLYILAAQIGQAVENAQLFAQIRRFNSELEQMVAQRTQALADEKERLEALYTIATELGATLDPKEIQLRTLALASRALSVSRGSIVLRDRESGQFVCRAVLTAEGIAEEASYEISLKDKRGLAYWIVEHPEAEGAVIADVRQDQRWVQLPGHTEEVRAVIAVPLMSEKVAEGVLMFTSNEPGVFTEDHLRFLRTIATEVTVALHNAELYELVLDSANRVSIALMQQKEEAGKREAILRSVSEGVIVLDTSSTVILYNPAAERVLQVPAEQVVGRSLQVFAESQRADGDERALLMYSGLHEGVRAVETSDAIFTSTMALGGQTIAANFAPVTSADGSHLGVVAVLRDITREIEADRAKREFISTVSHELRTPLTPIRGYVDLMLLGATGQLSETQRDCLNTIKSNTMRMVSLVEDLLEIGRIEAGKIKLNVSTLDMASLIPEIVAMLRPEIERKQMDLTLEIASDLPQVEADGKRIGQVLTNLVSNALKYTYAGGKVWVRAFMRDDEHVEVQVRDTGVGIKPEDQVKLFTRFFRTDNPLRDEAGGTGLGLSIAKSFIELHGGEMWVESELQAGSTFIFTLPVRQPAPELGEREDTPALA